ncbi:MAG: 50S ribosomal protein L28 [Chloroflexaceae bacterium]|nr:50S ribosomal protein L28 [Chloroflexaceae bacterium]
MAKCQITGKKPSFGHNVSHSKRRTRKVWRPNIQKVTILDEQGKPRQIKVCTSHLRTMYKTR